MSKRLVTYRRKKGSEAKLWAERVKYVDREVNAVFIVKPTLFGYDIIATDGSIKRLGRDKVRERTRLLEGSIQTRR